LNNYCESIMVVCKGAIKFGVAVLACFFVTACSPKQTILKRYFWPPLSDEPKIEYVDFYQTDYEVKSLTVGTIEEAIFGRENPTPLFANPFDVYSNGQGVLFVTEPVDGYVQILDLNKGTLERLRDRRGLPYSFKSPAGVTGDSRGRVFVVDTKENAILVFGPSYGLVDKWVNDQFKRLLTLVVDEGREIVYAVDVDRHEIMVLSSADGHLVNTIGGRGTDDGKFNFPLDVDLDEEGNLYVLDSMNARVQVFSPEGSYLREFGERGTALGSFQLPKNIAVGPHGNVYVTDSLAHRVVVFDLEGHHLLTLGGMSYVSDEGVTPGGFYLPSGIDVDDTEAIWVVDTLNRVLHRYQFLTPDYLQSHPILPGQAVNPFEKKE